jgi:exonuclease VII small subunit
MPAAKPSTPKSEPIDFEKAIVELESIVALQQAEQKVEILLKKSGQVLVEDFDSGSADA